MKYLYQMNCFGGNPYSWYYPMSFTVLLVFTAIALVFVYILCLCYNRISNKNKSKSYQIGIPIYNSKDIFSQEMIGDSNFVLAEKVTSIRSKLIVYGLIILFVTSSMSRILDPSSIFWLY